MSPQQDPEFQKYRSTLGAVVFGLTSLAIMWFASSVAYALYAQPAPSLTGPRFSGRPDDREAQLRCNADLRKLLDDLDWSAVTCAGGDARTVSDGRDERWREVGARCRFEELRDRGMGTAFDHLAWVHAELQGVHRAQAGLLKSYQASRPPRVMDLRHALETSRRTLEGAAPGPASSG